jgi:hypothetical protein
MTARMFPHGREMKKESLVTDFMQTVQLNYDLNDRYMRGTDTHQTDGLGHTALYWAIYHHNMHNVILLLEHGATLNVSDHMKAPFCAVNFDNLEVLIYLIEKGIDIMMEYQGETLFAYVNRLGSREMKSYFHNFSRARSGG